jgi:phosphoribosylformimino-5-aminoimidazole carboxamide ribotide isomerase
MLVIPVIDIKDGQCVRVIEGLYESTIFYSESPLKVARLFRKENFKTLHITDLDGALNGTIRNYDTIKEIVRSIDIPVQLGGGIRDFETAEKIINDLGVYRIVIGTAAITKPSLIDKLISRFSANKIVVGIDEKDNKIVKNGWMDYENLSAIEFAVKMQEKGVRRIIYQDVSTVGNYRGPNVERLIELSEATNLKITAAGGIRDFKDLKILQSLENKRIDSVMVSRAIYENKFPCQMIWRDVECRDISLDLPKVK